MLFQACLKLGLHFYSERSNRTKLMTMLTYILCLGIGLEFTLISAFFGHVEAGVDRSEMPGVSVLSPPIQSLEIS